MRYKRVIAAVVVAVVAVGVVGLASAGMRESSDTIETPISTISIDDDNQNPRQNAAARVDDRPRLAGAEPTEASNATSTDQDDQNQNPRQNPDSSQTSR